MYSNRTVLLVTYDLKGPSTQYTSFYNALKNQGAWMHYIASTWLIATRKTPNELFDELKPFIQENDHILIVKFNQEHYGWLPEKAWEWINTHAG